MAKPPRTVRSLAGGLQIEIALAGVRATGVRGASAVAQPIGTAWLNGVQMTIVPLVVALIVTGIAASAEAARAGRLTARALVTFVALLWAASALAALVTAVLLDLFPIPGGAAAGLADRKGTRLNSSH